MDLEKRVQRLEDDVNILKNQVRNTLLDIQEQLSAYYHPALRSQRPQRGGRGAAGPAEDVEEPEDEPRSEPDEAPRPPKVKRVSLDDIRHGPREEELVSGGMHSASETTRPAPDAVRPAPESRGAPALYAELLQWASASVDAIGAEHTRRVLETYAADGHLPAGLAESVIRLAALSSAAPADREPSLQETLEALRTLNQVLAGAESAGETAENLRG
jgi:hypothetical protein